MKQDLLTSDERECLNNLAYAWNKFVELPVLHHTDRREFATVIHTAMNIVMSRPVLRYDGIIRLEEDYRIYEE